MMDKITRICAKLSEIFCYVMLGAGIVIIDNCSISWGIHALAVSATFIIVSKSLTHQLNG